MLRTQYLTQLDITLLEYLPLVGNIPPSAAKQSEREGIQDSDHQRSAPPLAGGALRGDDQSPLLRDQIRLCAPSSPSIRRA
jgi:hypothetical protein